MNCTSPLFRIPLYPWEKSPRDFKVNNGAILLSSNKYDYEHICSVFPLKISKRLQMIPCGKCMSCRINLAESWSVRCAAELADHRFASFVTLTYDDDHLSYGYRINPRSHCCTYEPSLRKKDFQDFNKRLRKFYSNSDIKIRFFACGEYGSITQRPHYHAIYFGMPLPLDVSLLSRSNGITLYTSPWLEALWGKGMVSIGSVDWNSINYVCRYTTKKFRSNYLSDDDRDFYDAMRTQIVEIDGDRLVEDDFLLMSRRPGIGKNFYSLYKNDIYHFDKIILPRLGDRPKIIRPPRYYDKLYDLDFPQDYKRIKSFRLRKAERMAKNSVSNGLTLFEEFQRQDRKLRSDLLKRPRNKV